MRDAAAILPGESPVGEDLGRSHWSEVSQINEVARQGIVAPVRKESVRPLLKSYELSPSRPPMKDAPKYMRGTETADR